jgi:hypothetical protein
MSGCQASKMITKVEIARFFEYMIPSSRSCSIWFDMTQEPVSHEVTVMNTAIRCCVVASLSQGNYLR